MVYCKLLKVIVYILKVFVWKKNGIYKIDLEFKMSFL